SSIGVQFMGPTPEPPYEKPRMHNILPNSNAYIDSLMRECKKRGVTVITGARVERLLKTSAGRVIGARAAGKNFLGQRGVFLATGDYSAADDIKIEIVRAEAASVSAVNSANTCDGFRLGSDAGGAMLQMDRLYEGLRFPPSKLPDP